jgi:carboxyl-terminal processing protease
MDEEKYKDMKVEIKGKFFGVGIEITMKNGHLTVVAPIEDTPGFKAGLKPNDRIIKIDGKTTEGISIVEAVHRIRGDKGTPVVLTIHRDGMAESFDVEIFRDEIKIRSTMSKMMDNKIGYVRLKSFSFSASNELARDLENLKKQGMKGLIFDLRNNPGGLLSASISISDYFLSEGVIVSTKGRKAYENTSRLAEAKTTIIDKDIPIFLLINEGSASASEIVAGALKDHKRAVLYGTKSFGKASVQKFFPFKNDSIAVRLTIAKYYTPSGISIHGNGIEPNIKVESMKFAKAENESLAVFVKNKLMQKFLDAHKNIKYDEKAADSFVEFLKINKAPLGKITAKLLLKRELTLTAPVYDLEFDNQLKRAYEDLKKTVAK